MKTRKETYVDFHKQFCDDMIEITRKKNADYSGSGDDPFNNFRHIGNFVVVEGLDLVAVGFLTRMSDKFSRLGSYISKGKLEVADETVLDTLKDLANYSALFAGYLKERDDLARVAQKPLAQPK